ncbi:hypothetical protein QBC32DRAFT_376541 [Pseudoneurospora amorphoporcata]|uniref:Uncharacterized protein n=1 Tax=Pseudoneurospora amorphoporcata TaxID=241081 RepID=A0AAN6NV13_9PEZI|nr:hypothetical protein QBC32DRAFT_376541 [Pseudoneurospora amorphoporcata]
MPHTEYIQYAPPGSYLAYKRDSKLLLFWMSRTVHSIINYCYETRPDCLVQLLDELKDGLPEQKGSTELQADPAQAGFFTRARLIGFCRFIGAHMDFIPPSIIALFLNVINSRVAAFTTWKALAARRPRAENTGEFNAFGNDIRTLWKAFNALRGFHSTETALADQIISSISSNDVPGSEEDILFLIRGKFPIRVHPKAVEDQTGRHGNPKDPEIEAEFYKVKAIIPPDDLPLDHFVIGTPVYFNGILGDSNDYGTAVYDLFKEFVRLRNFLHDTWKDVIFDGLNSAVAVAVGNATMTLIDKYYDDMVPESFTYMSMIKYFTGYQNPEDHVQPFSASVYLVRGDGSCSANFETQNVDMKEQFMIYTFESLVEFLSDFRATQDGKPTERMTKLLQNWDPSIDLMSLPKEEYLQWRHLYTIKLLYSLGPTYFVTSIAKLAMKKPSPTNDSIRRSIQPNQVFKLQLMVDSFTVSKGCLYDSIRGPIFVQPPPADVFLPARDLALFLNVKFDDSVDEATRVHQQFGNLPDSLNKAVEVCSAAIEFQSGKHDQGAGSNLLWSNFLWGCSPFHCGQVLVDNLRDSLSLSKVFFSGFYHETVLLVHLHKMLVGEGYLKTSPYAIVFLETYFDALLSEEAKTLQDGAHYEHALSSALERLRNPVPGSIFERLYHQGYRTAQLGCLQNLQRLMEGTTSDEKKQVVQVKGHGSSNGNGFIIKGGHGRAKAVMDGIQAVGFKLKELVPGKMLEGPGGSKVMVSLRDVLELLRADVALGLHGSRCPDAVDRYWVSDRAKNLFENIEGELAAARDPLYLAIYGDPSAKEDESVRVKTLADMRRELVLRLLSRNLDLPGTKRAIEIATKAFENEELVGFPCLYLGLQRNFGSDVDEVIRKRLQKGLARPSCPFM